MPAFLAPFPPVTIVKILLNPDAWVTAAVCGLFVLFLDPRRSLVQITITLTPRSPRLIVVPAMLSTQDSSPSNTEPLGLEPSFSENSGNHDSPGPLSRFELQERSVQPSQPSA